MRKVLSGKKCYNKKTPKFENCGEEVGTEPKKLKSDKKDMKLKK